MVLWLNLVSCGSLTPDLGCKLPERAHRFTQHVFTSPPWARPLLCSGPQLEAALLPSQSCSSFSVFTGFLPSPVLMFNLSFQN